MKRTLNIFLGLLLSITIFLVIICFTLLNDNFIKHYFEKNEYYELLYSEVKENGEYEDLSEYKYYINKYIDSDYHSSLSDNSFSKYINKINYSKWQTIIYFSTFLFIIITGTLFNKTKKQHNLSNIILETSIILILIYGIVFIFNSISNEIIFNLVNISIHYLLGLAIILLEISLYLFFKNKYVKK